MSLSEEKLHVITMITNPTGFASRYRLYHEFAEYMKGFPDIVFWTVEQAIGDQEFQVTSADNPFHIQVRGKHAIWPKENLGNVGIRRLPKDWKYAAIVDSDLVFGSPHWVKNTIAKLKQYPIVQMFSEIVDLRANNTVGGFYGGYIYHYLENKSLREKHAGRAYFYGTTGFAWAYTPEGFNATNGLIDYAITGSADLYMVNGFFGTMEESIVKEIGKTCPEYFKKLLAWEKLALQNLGGRIGYVPGAVLHHWHGKRSDRGYETRNKMLVKNDFNPDRDVCYNSEGVIEFTGATPVLESEMLAYFASRKEDS